MQFSLSTVVDSISFVSVQHLLCTVTMATLVLDTGSFETRLGVCGEEAPAGVVRTEAGTYGRDALVADADALLASWRRAADAAKVQLQDARLLLAEATVAVAPSASGASVLRDARSKVRSRQTSARPSNCSWHPQRNVHLRLASMLM